MSGSSAIAEILEKMPSGLVRRASEHIRHHPVATTGILPLDHALGGGWACGRLNMLVPGPSASTGRTTVTTATIASITSSGIPAAWIDGDGSLDPASLTAAGVDTGLVLWVRGPMQADSVLKSVHEIILSGIFGVIVVRPAGDGFSGSNSMHWMRLSREAELSSAPILVLARGLATSGGAGVCAGFEPLRGEWSGPYGTGGLLEGASIQIDTTPSGALPAECLFRAGTSWEGFQ